MPRRLRILFMASEVDPFAKTGGLADVASALPAALHGLGHDVRILMPKYKGVVEAVAGDLTTVVSRVRIPLGDREAEGQLCEGRAASGVPVYFLAQDNYYDRFVFFCRGGLEAVARLGKESGGPWAPQVVHANDWQTGLVPVYLRTLYRDH